MLDLRKLFLMIKEQKEMDANLNLEFDCMLDTDDPKPLVKVINYIINYLTPLASNSIEISLNAHREGFMISFSVFTEHMEFPEFSDQLAASLAEFNARFENKFEQGKYIQIILYIS